MSIGQDEFATKLAELAEAAKDVPPCTTLFMDEEGDAVVLRLDNKRATYGDWIKGEGADICLYRDMETHKVMGCRLPLYQKELRVDRIEKGATE